MGIFSRLFQRGQDGNPVDASTGDEEGKAMNDEPEITLTSGTAVPPPAPVDEPTAPIAPALPGLTPAFATSGAAAPPSAEPRSMWDWPGPQPRKAERSTTNDSPPSAAPPEPRTSARAGALPSVPRSQSTAEPSRTDSNKQRDATIVVSPPP